MDIPNYVIEIVKIGSLVGLMIGLVIASNQLKIGIRTLEKVRRTRLFSSFNDALKHIADEDYGMFRGKLLRHWIIEREHPILVEEFEKFEEDEKLKILKLAMAHDRLAFILSNDEDSKEVYEWQIDEIIHVWEGLELIIDSTRGKKTNFCETLEKFVEGRSRSVWITHIGGVVKKGHRVASGKSDSTPYPKGTIDMQKPLFKKEGVDLESMYGGTINVSISPKKFQLVNPSYTIRDVKWASGFPSEDFSFSECAIGYRGEWYKGYVYYPHPETKIGHFQSDSTIEIISEYIPKLEYGSFVNLRLKKAEIELKHA